VDKCSTNDCYFISVLSLEFCFKLFFNILELLADFVKWRIVIGFFTVCWIIDSCAEYPFISCVQLEAVVERTVRWLLNRRLHFLDAVVLLNVIVSHVSFITVHDSINVCMCLPLLVTTATAAYFRPRSRGDNTFGSIHVCVSVCVRLWALSCLNHLTSIVGMKVDLDPG